MLRTLGKATLALAALLAVAALSPHEADAAESTQQKTSVRKAKKAPYGYHGRTWLLKERILRK